MIKAAACALCLLVTVPAIAAPPSPSHTSELLLLELKRPSNIWARDRLAELLYRTCRTNPHPATKAEIATWAELLAVDRVLLSDGSLDEGFTVREVALVCIEELTGKSFYPLPGGCAPLRGNVTTRKHGQVERFSIAEIRPHDLPDLQAAVQRWLDDTFPREIRHTVGKIGPGSFLTVSIPSLSITSGERVVGFKFHIKSGRVAALPFIPMGWNATVDNDPSWNTTIEGSIAVGTAALGPAFLKNFLKIEKDESLGTPFNVQAEIVVSEDFEHERHIQIGMKDLTLISTLNSR